MVGPNHDAPKFNVFLKAFIWLLRSHYDSDCDWRNLTGEDGSNPPGRFLTGYVPFYAGTIDCRRSAGTREHLFLGRERIDPLPVRHRLQKIHVLNDIRPLRITNVDVISKDSSKDTIRVIHVVTRQGVGVILSTEGCCATIAVLLDQTRQRPIGQEEKPFHSLLK